MWNNTTLNFPEFQLVTMLLKHHRDHYTVCNCLQGEVCIQSIMPKYKLNYVAIKYQVRVKYRGYILDYKPPGKWYEVNYFFNTSRPRQDGSRFPEGTFERIFLNENVIILIKISLKFVPKDPINNIPALVQIMA